MGNSCGGKGQAYGGVCYAYGSVIDGYLVMPARTSGCDDSKGDYCYAHLAKINVSYTDWQKAVETYEKDGNTKALEDLYRKTYGISFDAGSLYDSKANNANLLKAQALLSALTSVDVLQKDAATKNKELEAKGNLTKEEQALYDFNKQIIENKNLDKSYQTISQLNDMTAQQITLNTAVSSMYSDLVVANDADLTKLANARFKEIFGYDPASKYGGVSGILGAFGIDPAQLNKDRSNYADTVAAAMEKQKQAAEKQNQNIDKLNQEYKEYVSGQSESINDLKKAALNAGVITESEIAGKSEQDLLALLLSKFSGTTLVQEKANAIALINSRKENELVNSYINNQGGVAAKDDLLELYKIYVGHVPAYRMTTSELQKEIAKYNSSIATIYFQDRFSTAASNIDKDSGTSLKAVCQEMGMTSCNFEENGTQTISLMLDKIYAGNTEVNTPVLASEYSKQILAQSKETAKQANVDATEYRAKYAMAYDPIAIAEYEAATGKKVDTSALSNPLKQKEEVLLVAIKAANTFSSYQNLNYALQNSSFFGNYDMGLLYGEALMDDKIIGGNFAVQQMGLNAAEQFSLGYNKLAYQYANVNTITKNIATNYATSVSQNYSGPVNTNISDIALKGADSLGIFDTKNADGTIQTEYVYQAAQDGYYFSQGLNNVGATLADWVVTAGTFLTSSTPNTLNYQQIADSAINAAKKGDEVKTNIQTNFYTQQAANYINQDQLQGISNPDIKQSIVDKQVQDFVTFQTDQGIVRSRQELNWETVEKVVAPTAAVIALPVAIASGAGLGPKV